MYQFEVSLIILLVANLSLNLILMFVLKATNLEKSIGGTKFSISGYLPMIEDRVWFNLWLVSFPNENNPETDITDTLKADH